MDLSLFQLLLLSLLGVLAGIINMMAGGGSNLILPVLMLFGVPADVANASNRVGVLLQSISGTAGFYRAKRLPTEDLPAIMLPTLLGGLVGALAASYVPVAVLKPVLLLTVLSVAAAVALKPSLLVRDQEVEPFTVAQNPQSRWWLFATGIYGGFVQAATGFVMLPVLAGILCYDLVRATALRVCCTLGFTIVALIVFLSRGQVDWIIGLVLAAGSSIGAQIGVHTVIKLRPETLRKILFLMTLVAVVMAFLK